MPCACPTTEEDCQTTDSPSTANAASTSVQIGGANCPKKNDCGESERLLETGSRMTALPASRQTVV